MSCVLEDNWVETNEQIKGDTEDGKLQEDRKKWKHFCKKSM